MAGLLTLDQVKVRPRVPLWPEFLFLGEATLFAAEGGAGKGLLGAAITACVTTGNPWPGEPEDMRRDPMTVILITPEDDEEKDLRGRLDAAGADVRYVVCLTKHEDGRAWKLTDLPALVRLIQQMNDPDNDEYAHLPMVGLVLLDPLTKLFGDKQYISSRLSANNVLGAISSAAKAANVAIVINHHVNRDGSVNGSRALLDSLKMCFRIDKSKEVPGEREISSIKTNITAGGGLKYRVSEAPNGFPVATFVVPADEREADAKADDDRQAALECFSPPVSATQEAPHRALCMVDRPGAEMERRVLGDALSMREARGLCQSSVYAQGTKLVWVIRDDGMETATRVLPGGGQVKFAAYALTGEAEVKPEPSSLPAGSALSMPWPRQAPCMPLSAGA